MASKFVHLHVHSHYSLLDGLPKIPDLVQAALKYEMPAIALTDHGVMYGTIEFYKACKAAGIKPILGVEAYLAFDDLHKKQANVDDDYYHLTLLAKDLEGYRNLLKLVSIAHLEGFYYKPRIDKNVLKKHSQGLIALSGCLRGEIPRLILSKKYKDIEKTLREYQDIFGKDNFFLEVQYHPESRDQQIVNEYLRDLALKTGAPLVATTDSHYLDPKDSEAQDILVCIQTGKTQNETDRLDMRRMDLSLKNPELMIEAFRDFPQAIENTLQIAQRCNVELELGKWKFPYYPLPENLSADEYLRKLAEEGFQKKFPDQPEDVRQRMEYELDIIRKKGFATYFLVVADYASWARKNGIIATTRGSAAGSLVAYLIGITTVDPLKFKLPFERFLNPYRPSPPDIDIDFADNRRDEVLNYVREKYGKDKVAQIVTFGTLMAKAAVRDVVRVLGYSYSFGDKIAKMIPPGPHGTHMSVALALEMSSELRALYETNEEVKRILDLAQKIEGCARHASVHAAGVVIAPEPLDNFLPLQREPGGENIITQYEMHAIEDIGLLKMDFLGVRNLSILGDCVKLVKKTKGVDIDLTKIDFNDKATYDLIARGETTGLFQLSGAGMTRYLMELKPTNIHDIMAMVALFRPGPMESIPEFIRRKHNPKLIKYLDPRLEEILKESYGIITYQDDVLLIAIKLAGYTWEEADKLRKAIGKKIPQEMAAQKEKFINGLIKNNMSKENAEKLWQLIEPFAAYGFNKAHAASYAVVAYQTAYMKAHFPAEFMTSVLTAESGDNEKVAEIIEACRRMGIEVLPPNVNESLMNFTYINDKQIRFGLLAIKNLGQDIIEEIIAERKRNGPYKSIEDFLQRIKHKNLNKKTLESLIKSGALDIFGDRILFLRNLENLLNYRQELNTIIQTNQKSLFGSNLSLPRLRLENLNEHVSLDQKLQWEKDLLGVYVSGHPLHKYTNSLPEGILKCVDINEEKNNSEAKIAGVLTSVKKIFTKNNDIMIAAQCEDTTGNCEVIVFPKIYSQNQQLWQENNLLFIQGKILCEENRRKIICNAASLLDDFLTQQNNRPKQMFISLAPKNVDKIAQIKELLDQAEKGNVPVYLCLLDNFGLVEKTIKTNLQVKIDEELKIKLKSILGDSAIQIKQ